MALKDAGVTRARFGDVELEFAPAVTPPADEDYVAVELPTATVRAPQTQEISAVDQNRPGYAALFARPPRFAPAE